jgi:2-iminobutanoate/2-iminopropanoate deaminase
MKDINTNKAPKAVGPYSQAIAAGDFVFCSGQIGINPKTGVLAEGIEKQTKQGLENLKNVIEAAGAGLKNVVKTTIYLKNLADFEKVNKIYADFFEEHRPARATVEVSALPKGALVEIEAIVYKKD